MRFSSSLFLSLTSILPIVAIGEVVNAQALYYPAENYNYPVEAASPPSVQQFAQKSEDAVAPTLHTGLSLKSAGAAASAMVSSISSTLGATSMPQPVATLETASQTTVAPQPANPIAQAPAPSPQPGTSTPTTPRPGTESVPTQETPDRIDFNQNPSTPTLELPQPEPQAPAEPINPAPVPTLPAPTAPSTTIEPRVLVAEVLVSGTDDVALQNAVYGAVQLRPGRTTTQTELQQDVNAVFATGFFSRVGVTPEDTPLGVRITFVVTPNPTLTRVVVEGRNVVDNQPVLPDKVIEDIFSPQYGKILNLRSFQDGVKKLNDWYQENGYVLAQVIDTPQVASDGTVTLVVAEGVVENIEVRFLTKDGNPTDDNGRPIQGRTRDFIITREFNLKPGDVFQRSRAQDDLQRVFSLGIFDDVRLSLNPSPTDPRKVIVVANVIERSTGSLAAGAGISSASGLFGTVSYQEQNVGGNNQKFGAEFQLGEREQLFDISFTDPWIGGDPFRTSYSVNAFNRRSISLVFDGGRNEVRLPNGDVPRIDRLGGGLNFSRPLGEGWVASVGLQYQLVSTRNNNRDIVGADALGNPLTFSRSGVDDLYSVQFGAVRDRRNDPLRPTSGSLLRFGMEQTIPLGQGNILYNRLRGSYSYYIPVEFLRLGDGPQALAFNVQAGTVLGDLPPYEAFALGGVNSVRGYEEGGLGSGRSFVQATAEYRFPIISIVGGAVFLDAASDLGSASSVLGNPAGVRRKPGSGYGYGLGLRIQTPLGPLRIDYGINDLGNSRIHFGIGERF